MIHEPKGEPESLFDFKSMELFRRALLCGAAFLMQGTLVAAQESQAVKPTAITEQYGAWTLVCQSTLSGAAASDTQADAPSETCGLRTSIVVQDQAGARRPLAAAFVARDADGEGYAIVFQVPPGVYLRAPVELRAGDAEADADALLSASYVNCAPGACIADARIPAETMTALQEAATLQLVFVGADRRRIGVPFPREGLTQAVQALSSRP